MAYIGTNANNQVELRTTRFRFTATEGQTKFTATDTSTTGDNTQVYLNGIFQSEEIICLGEKTYRLTEFGYLK